MLEPSDSAGRSVALVPRFPRARPFDASADRVGFLFTLARFSEGFLILTGSEWLSATQSPLALAMFNLAFVASPTGGALSDRFSPKAILIAGIAALVAANLGPCPELGMAGLRRRALWGAHGADPGIAG